MPLSRKQLGDVCMLYQGDHRQCKYLRIDQYDSECYCLKKKIHDKKKIDIKVSDFLRECKKKGHDPLSQNIPLGDNCQGYPILKHAQQGYDQKT